MGDFASIGVLFGLPGGLLIYQGNPSMSPNRTPMFASRCLIHRPPRLGQGGVGAPGRGGRRRRVGRGFRSGATEGAEGGS